MRRLIPAFFTLLFLFNTGFLNAQEITAKEVIAKSAEAMGGMENLQKLQTIRVYSVYPDHGDKSIIFEFKRPNMSRSADGKLVFDGKRACWVKGKDGESAPELIVEEHWFHFEIDTAFVFPAYFDFPTEYVGTEEFKGRNNHKLIVTMPLGTRMEYLVDAETWIPVRVGSTITSEGKEIQISREYFDFREVEGVVFPFGFVYPSRENKLIEGWIKKYELNVPFEDGYFELPELP